MILTEAFSDMGMSSTAGRESDARRARTKEGRMVERAGLRTGRRGTGWARGGTSRDRNEGRRRDETRSRCWWLGVQDEAREGEKSSGGRSARRTQTDSRSRRLPRPQPQPSRHSRQHHGPLLPVHHRLPPGHGLCGQGQGRKSVARLAGRDRSFLLTRVAPPSACLFPVCLFPVGSNLQPLHFLQTRTSSDMGSSRTSGSTSTRWVLVVCRRPLAAASRPPADEDVEGDSCRLHTSISV